MIKFFVIYTLILAALAMFGRKNNSATQRVFFYFHLFGSILLTGFGLFHGVGYFLSAPLKMQLTGSVILLLLIAEIILGFRVYKKDNLCLKKAHIWLAVLILCMVILHLILLKLF